MQKEVASIVRSTKILSSGQVVRAPPPPDLALKNIFPNSKTVLVSLIGFYWVKIMKPNGGESNYDYVPRHLTIRNVPFALHYFTNDAAAASPSSGVVGSR